MAERTIFHDDGNRSLFVDRTDFDGFGHHRSTTTFERLRNRLPHLAPRPPRQAVPMLTRELQEITRNSKPLPSIRSLQRDLTRAVEAAGGLSKVASHLRTPTLGVVERAFSLVRSFARGKSR